MKALGVLLLPVVGALVIGNGGCQLVLPIHQLDGDMDAAPSDAATDRDAPSSADTHGGQDACNTYLVGSAACARCLNEYCCDLVNQCSNDGQCPRLISCVVACQATCQPFDETCNLNCENTCQTLYPMGTQDLENLQVCETNSCSHDGGC